VVAERANIAKGGLSVRAAARFVEYPFQRLPGPIDGSSLKVLQVAAAPANTFGLEINAHAATHPAPLAQPRGKD
jgi:hypothetical protein